MGRFFCAFVAALATSLVLTPIARRLAVRLGVVDKPDGKRKLQANAVPLLGGVAVYLSLLVGLAVVVLTASDQNGATWSMAFLLGGVAGFICLFGYIDDWCELKPRTKLLLQIIATLPIVLGGYSIERTVLFGVPIEWGWLGIPLTVLWLVACINALNLLDGMDGLASVVGVATAAMIALIAMNSSHAHVSIMAVVLAGALIGFLAYNLPPATIYLGDSGSMVIGLVVGVLAIQGAMQSSMTQSSATLSLVVPAVVMTIPFLDTGLAVVRRRLSGSRFDTADRGHIHHCLLRRGLTVWQSLAIVGALCVVTGAAAAVAAIWHLEAIAWIAAIAVATLLVRTRAFGHYEWALVKLATANFLASFARRLAMSADSQQIAGDAPLNEEPFDHAWHTLTDAVARLDAVSVELEHDGQVLRRWQSSDTTREHGPTWQFTVREEADPNAWIELAATGTGQGAAQGWNHLQINRLLYRFHRDWSSHALMLAEESGTDSVQEESVLFEPRKAA